MAEYIMALDAGTTSERCILFNRQGEMVIRNANSDVMDIFEVTGFTDILHIE